MKLYQRHEQGLQDSAATIVFTKKINDIFDLLNRRHPADAIRNNSRLNKLQVIKFQQLLLRKYQGCDNSGFDHLAKLN